MNSQLGRIETETNAVPRCLQVKEDLLFSGWMDWSLKMHDVRSGKQIWSLEKCQKGGVTALELSKNSKNICTGGTDG